MNKTTLAKRFNVKNTFFVVMLFCTQFILSQASLTYEGGFTETSFNYGAVSGQMTILPQNTVFRLVSGGYLIENVDYIVHNTPAGLNPKITVANGGVQATLTFTGRAVENEIANSVKDIQITFLPTAFFDPTTPVNNSVKAFTGVSIIFNRNASLTYGNGFSLEAGIKLVGSSPAYYPDNQRPGQLQLSEDGRFLYDYKSLKVRQLELSTPFDITTANLIGTLDVSDRIAYNSSIALSPDGNTLVVIGRNFGTGNSVDIIQYKLSTPFYIKSAVYEGMIDKFVDANDEYSSQFWPFFGIHFSYDGRTLYGYDPTFYFFWYTLKEPFNALTVQPNSRRINAAPSGPMYIPNSGDKLIILSMLRPEPKINGILTYNLSTPFNISTRSTYEDSTLRIPTENNPLDREAMWFNPQGTKLYLNNDNGPIDEFDVTVPNPFIETTANDGTIQGQQRINIAGGVLFNKAGGTLNYNSDYSISNLPAGLTPVLTVDSSGTYATLTFSGSATNNQAADNVASLNFTFNDSAFNNKSVKDILNSNNMSSEISITFKNNPPIAICKSSAVVYLDTNGEGTIAASDLNNGSTAVNGIASLTSSKTSFNCSDIGGQDVTLTVTDNLGLTDTCRTTVSIVDSIAPVIVTRNITVQLDGNGSVTITPEQIDNGSSDNCIIASMSLDKTSFDCTNKGENEVLLTVTDSKGNKNTATAIVTVEDNITPHLVCKNIVLPLDKNGIATLLPNNILDESSALGCNPLILSVSKSNFTCADIGNNSVNLTATYQNGDVLTCSANVTVVDNIKPIAICQNLTVQLDASGKASITATQVDAGSTDNCAISDISIDVSSFDCSNIGDNNVVLTVTDTNGNTSSCTAVVTVEDLIPPTAVCKDITVQLDDTGKAIVTKSDLDGGSKDNCSFTYEFKPAQTISQPDYNDAGGAYNFGESFTSNFTGFLSKIRFLVNDVNNLTNRTIHLYKGANGSGVTASVGTPDYTESGLTFKTAGPNDIWTEVKLTKPFPVIAGEKYSFIIDGLIDLKYNTQYTGTDTYSGGTLINAYNEIVPDVDIAFGLDFIDNNIFYCSDVGTVIKRGLLVTDTFGNTASCTANITVVNKPPKAITKNITVPLDSNGNASITVDDINNGSTTPSCGSTSLKLDKTSFDCSNLGDNTVTLTVTDVNNVTSSATATVTIVDNTAPTAVTQNLTLDIVNGNLTITPEQVNNNSTDNCGIASMSLDKTSFDCTNIGDNTVTLTVMDSSGNKDTTTATITVSGIKASFTSDTNAVCRNTPVNFTDTSIAYGAANTNFWMWDFGDGTNSTEQNPSHSYDLPGNYVVSLTTTDSNGCQNTATTTIRVTPPKANFVLNPAIGSTIPHTVFFTDQSILPDTWAWDFGDGNTSAAQNPIHAYTSFGDFTAKLVVTDTIYGCTDSLEKTVKIAKPNSNFTSKEEKNGSVFDCGPLTVNFKDASTVSGNDTINSWLWDFGDGTTSTEQNPVYTYENSGVYTVSLTTQLAITGFSETKTITNYVQVLGPNVDFSTNSITTGCPDLTVNFKDQSRYVSPPVGWNWDFGDGNTSNSQNPTHTYSTYGKFDVSLTVTDLDGCSRTLTKQAFVNTSDEVPPNVLTKDVVVALNDSGTATITSTQIDNGSNDNCKIATMSLNKTTFDCASVGENTVNLTVTDASGNQNSATAFVTVKDTIAPLVVTKDIVVALNEIGSASVTAEEFLDEGYDNCSISTLSIDRTDFDCANIGNYIITLTAKDPSGNSTKATANLSLTGNDIDGDLITDVCDDDMDGDGVLNDSDNCPTTYNPDQGDIDHNGVGDVCDKADLSFEKGFSPNGDGIRDKYIITGLAKWPDNKFEVFNRWGNKVFSELYYKNDWDGVARGNNVFNKNKKLPAGPYFYVLEVGNNKVYKGWIYINY